MSSIRLKLNRDKRNIVGQQTGYDDAGVTSDPNIGICQNWVLCRSSPTSRLVYSEVDQTLKMAKNYCWERHFYPAITGSTDDVLLIKSKPVTVATWYKPRVAENAFFYYRYIILYIIIHNQIQLLQAWCVINMHNMNFNHNNSRCYQCKNNNNFYIGSNLWSF